MGGLNGRVALVTGVSRRRGIGFAVVKRLLDDGAAVLVHSWAPHDVEQLPGAEADGSERIVADLGASNPRVAHAAADLADPGAPARLAGRSVEEFGALDILIANHARSARQSLAELTADEVDHTFAVNARASALLVKEFAARHDDRRPGGAVHIGPGSRTDA